MHFTCLNAHSVQEHECERKKVSEKKKEETHASVRERRDIGTLAYAVRMILTKMQLNRTFSVQHLIAIFFHRQLLDKITPEGI